MENMFNYIFGSLIANGESIKQIDRAIRRQNRINKRTLVFSAAVTTWIYVSEMQHKKEKEELEKRLEDQKKTLISLGAQVQALKSEKGEAQM